MPEVHRTEKQHMGVLTNCKFPLWAVGKMECKNFQQNKPNNTVPGTTTKNSNNQNNKTYKGYIVLPYIQGLCELLKTYTISVVSTHISGATEQSRIYL